MYIENTPTLILCAVVVLANAFARVFFSMYEKKGERKKKKKMKKTSTYRYNVPFIVCGGGVGSEKKGWCRTLANICLNYLHSRVTSAKSHSPRPKKFYSSCYFFTV
jgi:hypothetical protein